MREKRSSWPCQPGTAKGMLTIHEDDDEHLADFREYMDEVASTPMRSSGSSSTTRS